MQQLHIDGIKIIATDIDGVLTDGHAIVDIHGNEFKRIYFRDLDAVGSGRRAGLDFVFVTGESNRLVDVVAERFSVTEVYRGIKDKVQALNAFCEKRKLSLKEICYIGDSTHDRTAIMASGFGVAPRDAALAAKKSADYVTAASGGGGVLAEVVELFLERKAGNND